MGISLQPALVYCVLAMVCSHAALTVAQKTRPVFAHYMLYYPDSMDVYMQEIALAQKAGIDAFALNLNVLDSTHQTQVDLMFQAAKDSPGSFKLFFSADMHADQNGALTVADLLTMLSPKYTSHPNHMTYGPTSLPLFTSWVGGDDADWQRIGGYSTAVQGWTDVFNKAGGKQNFFFIPFFANAGNYGGVLGMFNTFGNLVDGFFAWDTSAWNYINGNYSCPYDGRDDTWPSDQNAIAAAGDVDKVFMASASPMFVKNVGTDCSQTANHEVLGNYAGPGLWITKWNQIISDEPDLVEIVTWNDWYEGSYVSPGLGGGAAASGVNVSGFSHQAYLELGRYYIEWYKTGQPPSITNDSVYLFYYTQSQSSVVTNPSACPILNSGVLTDKIYATVLLSSPGTVELFSGGSSSGPQAAPAGVSTFSMDFQEGSQSVTLTVNGQVTTLNGVQQISNSNLQSYNFLIYSTSSTGS